jgi:hypothetical protein
LYASLYFCSPLILDANDYSPASNNSHICDQYWNEVERAAAFAPMMLCPGNHESQFSFAAHLNRTHMPVVGTGPLKRFYYSFEYGPIHFITISTEHPYQNNTEQWEACFLSALLT